MQISLLSLFKILHFNVQNFRVESLPDKKQHGISLIRIMDGDANTLYYSLDNQSIVQFSTRSTWKEMILEAKNANTTRSANGASSPDVFE